MINLITGILKIFFSNVISNKKKLQQKELKSSQTPNPTTLPYFLSRPFVSFQEWMSNMPKRS